MIKNTKLKIFIIMISTIIMCLLGCANSFAYEADNIGKSFNIQNEQLGNIIEANLETGEMIEKLYSDVVNTQNLRSNQITHVEGYRQVDDNGISPNAIIVPDQSFSYDYDPRICALVTTWSDGTKIEGTGFLVGKTTILTAGHMIYDALPHYDKEGNKISDPKGMAVNISVTPGIVVKEMPYGSTYAVNAVFEPNWRDNGNPDYDWGILVLSDSFVNKVGSFGFAYSDNYSGWVNKYVTVNGYGLGSKAYKDKEDENITGWMQSADRNIVTKAESLYMEYITNSFEGHSGSPVIEDNTRLRCGNTWRSK